MDEHEDDAEPEVEEGAEFETEKYSIHADEEDDEEDESADPESEPDIDPDKSEI